MQKCTVPLICAHLYEQIKSYTNTNTTKTPLDVKSNICLKLVDSMLKLFAEAKHLVRQNSIYTTARHTNRTKDITPAHSPH